MDLGLGGRKAIVCASSRGLGRGCAVALAEAGCDVVINGRSRDTLEATADDMRSRFPDVEVTAVAADVGTAEGRAELLAACPAPDILVNNNAGPPLKDFREVTPEAIHAGIDQNMVTPLELIRATIDGMAERGFGRIVNITSSSVKAPIPGLDLSSGARAGLTAYLVGVGNQVAASNVTINNLLPGRFETDRLTNNWAWAAERSGRSVEDLRDDTVKSIPARRLGSPEEFGHVCAFLCSVHAGYITGQNILMDGGLIGTTF